jgi:hypothetical protein
MNQTTLPPVTKLADDKWDYKGKQYSSKADADKARAEDLKNNAEFRTSDNSNTKSTDIDSSNDTNAIKTGDVNKTTGTVESFDYFTEDSPRAASGNKDNKSKINPGTGSSDVEKASKGLETADKLKASSPEAKDSHTAGVDDKNKDEVLKAANALLDTDIYNRQARVNADVQISSSIARSLYGSFQQLNKDFYWIIQKHVQWYLSNPGEETKTENQRAKVASLNMNAGDASVNTKDQVQTTSQAKAEAQKKQNDFVKKIEDNKDEASVKSAYDAWDSAGKPKSGKEWDAVSAAVNALPNNPSS